MAIGVVASVLLLPLNAKAQKTPAGLKDSNPPTELRVSKKMTPAERQAKMNEHIAKRPLLHKRLVPQMAKRDSLVRLNRNIEAGIKTKQTPQVPILRAKDAKPMTFWGNVLYDATWGAETPEYGIYTFGTEAPISVKKQFLDEFFRATGAGAWIEDNLYFVMYQNFWGTDMIYFYHYDTNTWEKKVEKRIEDYSLIACETAVAADGTVYGVFYSADGNSLEWGTVDYETCQRTTIGPASQAFVAIGITKAGQLYAIGMDGKLYKVNKSTGEETLVGATGLTLTNLMGQYYGQSGEIDQRDDTFYWYCIDNQAQGGLYTVDLNTGKATLLDGTLAQVQGMVMAQPEANDGAPERADNLAVEGVTCDPTVPQPPSPSPFLIPPMLAISSMVMSATR